MILPEIYKNKINYKENTTSSIKNKPVSKNIILKEIPVKVYLETDTKKMTTTIVGRTKNYVITKERDVIYIKDIITLEKA